MAKQGSNPSHRIGSPRDKSESSQRHDEERSRRNQHGGSEGGGDQQSAFSRDGRQMGESATDNDRNAGGSFGSHDRFASISRWGISSEWHLDDGDAEWRRDRYRKFSDEFDMLQRDRAARSDRADGGSADRSAAGSAGVTATPMTGGGLSASSGTDVPAPGTSSAGADSIDIVAASLHGKSR